MMHSVQDVGVDADQAPHRPHFIIGQDPSGQWLAVETHQLGGGFFKSRADAVHFAQFETGHRPDAVEFSNAPVRLTF